MKRLITLVITITAALTLAACGGGSRGGASSAAGSDTNTKTVAVRQLSGVGSVLVDDTGKALYTNDLEAGGKIVCDGACNAFWKPLTPDAAKPTASAGAGKLAVITRPDGSKQVTDNGKPLYTFVEDSPGRVTGNGFHDAFGGHHFTWDVVHAGATTAGGAAPAGSGAGGGSSTTGGSGGSYGY